MRQPQKLESQKLYLQLRRFLRTQKTQKKHCLLIHFSQSQKKVVQLHNQRKTPIRRKVLPANAVLQAVVDRLGEGIEREN